MNEVYDDYDDKFSLKNKQNNFEPHTHTDTHTHRHTLTHIFTHKHRLEGNETPKRNYSCVILMLMQYIKKKLK